MAGPAGTLCILAGGGALPALIAQAAMASGRPVHILAIEGSFDDLAAAPCPATRVGLGQVGGILGVMRAEGCDELVIAGYVERPELAKLKLDFGALSHLPRLAGMLLGGDNHLLSAIVRFFEAKGFKVVGAQDVAPALLARSGPLGQRQPTSEHASDLARGFEIVRALGSLDIGQAAVVSRGYTLAVEAAEGTDALLQRVADLRRRKNRLGGKQSGVLVKRAKPGQDRRVDLPTIGPRTVELAAAANLAGIGVQADGVLLVERARLLQLAEAAGLFVVGVADGD